MCDPAGDCGTASPRQILQIDLRRPRREGVQDTQRLLAGVERKVVHSPERSQPSSLTARHIHPIKVPLERRSFTRREVPRATILRQHRVEDFKAAVCYLADFTSQNIRRVKMTVARGLALEEDAAVVRQPADCWIPR